MARVFGHLVLPKFLKAVFNIFQFMSELTSEQRKELLFELDKVSQEVKSLAQRIRGTTDRLEGVAKNLRDYIMESVDRSSAMSESPYMVQKLEWNPAEFDLMQLKSDSLRLRELLKREDELERRLHVSFR